MTERFTGSFTQQEPIPEDAIEAAVAVMRSGRLHRYNTLAGEAGEAALLEKEFAELTGAKYCVATGSGGIAITTALRAVGVQPGDPVLTNAFTLAPVPGAIAAVGARPIYAEVTESLVIDLDDLEAKIGQARVLLLSHMRGHLCDMDRLMAICDAAGVKVVEDCAHTMGAAWNGQISGRQGLAGCYSTQTYKHVNSGEGGFMVTDDAEVAARAIILTGSYMLYGKHLAAPGPEVFERVKYDTPNVSGRMDNLRAAILRPQLRNLQGPMRRLERPLSRGRGRPARHTRPDGDRTPRGGDLCRLLHPISVAGLVRRGGAGGPGALCRPRGRAEMVRRGGASGIHLAL